jgi:proteasome lid subunit RPN8/RPN11
VQKADREVVRAAHRRFRARDDFEVIVAEQVIERAVAIGRSREPMEWMGLLVGRVCEDARGPYACVLGMVLDRDAEAGRHAVRSTPESEAATRALARYLFPDCVALGWIHGHIRHGVHFSGVDRDNQRTWRQAHSVGIVVDPWASELLAVYRGPDSERLSPVAVSTAERSAPVTPPSLPGMSERGRCFRGGGRPRHLRGALLALVAAVAGHAAGMTFALRSRVDHLEQLRADPAAWIAQVVVVGSVAPPVEASEEPLLCLAAPAPVELFSRAPPSSQSP